MLMAMEAREEQLKLKLKMEGCQFLAASPGQNRGLGRASVSDIVTVSKNLSQREITEGLVRNSKI